MEHDSGKSFTDQTSDFDNVTALPNRRYFVEQMPRWIDDSHQEGYAFSLYAVTVTALEKGHSKASQVNRDLHLRVVSEQLKKLVSNDSLLYRVSDDTFLLVHRYQGQYGKVFFESVQLLIVEIITDEKPLFSIAKMSVGCKRYFDEKPSVLVLLDTADNQLFDQKWALKLST